MGRGEGKRGLSAPCCARVTVVEGRSRKGEWVVRIRWKKDLMEGDETPDRCKASGWKYFKIKGETEGCVMTTWMVKCSVMGW